MAWFTSVLAELRALHAAIERDPSDKNFQKFYTKAEKHFLALQQESTDINYLMSQGNRLQGLLDSIKARFEDMLHLKDEISSQKERGKQAEVRKIKQSLEDIQSSLQEMRKNLDAFEKLLVLVKERQKKVER